MRSTSSAPETVLSKRNGAPLLHAVRDWQARQQQPKVDTVQGPAGHVPGEAWYQVTRADRSERAIVLTLEGGQELKIPAGSEFVLR